MLETEDSVVERMELRMASWSLEPSAGSSAGQLVGCSDLISVPGMVGMMEPMSMWWWVKSSSHGQ